MIACAIFSLSLDFFSGHQDNAEILRHTVLFGVLRRFQWVTGCETGLFWCSRDTMEARMTSALTSAQTHSLTRSSTTLSHPMGEGQEGESFAAPWKIYMTGLAGRSSAKQNRPMSISSPRGEDKK
jgi:hypothetical protein